MKIDWVQDDKYKVRRDPRYTADIVITEDVEAQFVVQRDEHSRAKRWAFLIYLDTEVPMLSGGGFFSLDQAKDACRDEWRNFALAIAESAEVV